MSAFDDLMALWNSMRFCYDLAGRLSEVNGRVDAPVRCAQLVT
ncbi:MAG TPA: hypothetical protein VH442_09600 [Micromonosporaceae bacterium]